MPDRWVRSGRALDAPATVAPAAQARFVRLQPTASLWLSAHYRAPPLYDPVEGWLAGFPEDPPEVAQALYWGRVAHGRALNLQIEIEREEDGRWMAEVPELPGVMTYGATRDQAIAQVQALALRVLAERLEHGEAAPDLLSVSFKAA